MNNGDEMKQSIFILFIIIISSVLFAGDIQIDEALLAAQNHIAAKSVFARNDAGIDPWDSDFEFTVAAIEPLNSGNGELVGYVASLFPSGYIALSADTDIRPIIAYSFTDNFRWTETADNILLTMLRRDLQLRKSAIHLTDQKVIDDNNRLWMAYTSGNKNLLAHLETAETVGPWLDSEWNQGAPYNTYCPMDPGTGERAVVGCVATAMGMIIDYWEWPPSVTFYSSDSYYSEGTSPRIWINATTGNIDTIDYNGAGFSPTNDMKARISFACAVACEMQFSSDGSASDTRRVPDALLERFDYDSARGVSIMNSQFFSILENNMHIAKPVELGIWGIGAGGHAIVADGWMTSGEYHLNMGWGGYENGWYFLPEGMPSGFNMIGHQACDIKPPVITRRPPFGLEGRTTTDGGIVLSWEEPLYITESILHYNIYRKTTYSDYELVGTSPTLSFVDTGIEELTYYNYAVSATYDAGESSSTNFSIYSGIFGGWARNWGGAGEQTAYDVAPAPDLGCIAVGFSRYSMYHDSDVYIVRTVPGGSRVWSRLYGGDGDDYAYSVILDSDSNYVVVGETEDTVTGDYDVWLLKIDDEGDTLWTATYGTSQRDAGKSVKETTDGGYIIAGYTGDIGSEQAYFVKTDRDGDIEWSQIYSNATVAKDIAVVSSGGYIATGYTDDGPLGRKDFYLIRLDSSGDSLWANNSGGAFNDVGNSIIETEDSGFLIAGNSYSYGIPVFSGIHLRKVDSSGDSTWAANYTAMSNYTANSVARLQSGGYIIAGSAEVASNIDFFILALDEDGDSLWARLYGTLGTDIAYSAVQLPDTGVVTAGVTFMDGSNDFWIMKFGGDVTTHVADNSRQIPSGLTISTYPNPFNSAVSIVTEPSATITVYDMGGRVVGSAEADNTGTAIWRPGSEIGSGLYLISSAVGGKTKVAKTAYIR